MVAILKILKTKSTILSDDLFLRQVSTLPKAATHIPTKVQEVWWKESKIFLNPPFFVSMATAAKFLQPIPIFLAYLVPLDVDVVPIKFHPFNTGLTVATFSFVILYIH